MKNSESNKSVQHVKQGDETLFQTSKLLPNAFKTIMPKKSDSVKRRSRTITQRNVSFNDNTQIFPKQMSTDKSRVQNKDLNQDKENIQPNCQRDSSLKELNALSALKRLSDFNDFDDPYSNIQDETFRGINGWNASEDASNPVSQRILKEKDIIIHKKGNITKKEKNNIQQLSHNNNYPYKNILTNMSNNIDTYEKQANQLLNMDVVEKEMTQRKERENINNNGQKKEFGDIVQQLKKLNEDLSSPEKSRNESLNQINGKYVKSLNYNLQKIQKEKSLQVQTKLQQKRENFSNGFQNKYITSTYTPNGYVPQHDYKNIQELLNNVTTADKTLKIKFNEDFSINVANNNLLYIEKTQEERKTLSSSNTAYLNTSSSAHDIDNLQTQTNQQFMRSKIESNSQAIDQNILNEISKRKKNHIIRVVDTEKYDKNFIQSTLNLKSNSQYNTNSDISNISIFDVSIQNPINNEKQQSPASSNQLTKQIETQNTETENYMKQNNMNGTQHNTQVLIINKNDRNIQNNTSINQQNSQESQHEHILRISKSISLGKSYKNPSENENNKSKTQVTNTPNSVVSQKQKDINVIIRGFPNINDIQNGKKNTIPRLNENETNPYNIKGNTNNIFYQPNHIPQTPSQLAQSITRNSYNPKIIPQDDTEKTKNEKNWSKSFSQNSHTLIIQGSVQNEKKQQPTFIQQGVNTLLINNTNLTFRQNNPQYTQQSTSPNQKPLSSQNLYNALQKRIQQNSLSMSSNNQQITYIVPNQLQVNGPSRSNSSNKLVLPPKPKSNTMNATQNNIQVQQNKSKLPKLFINSNRTFLRKVNSRNEELKGVQSQAQKGISNSFL